MFLIKNKGKSYVFCEVVLNLIFGGTAEYTGGGGTACWKKKLGCFFYCCTFICAVCSISLVSWLCLSL